ncbi:MAG: hypothetical protein JRH07_16130 [Deltaproteobacteria bacterium]|nr:hypothetical protein [Deltaproteobacteria bacterium]
MDVPPSAIRRSHHADDVQFQLVVKNVRKFLPATGKIKALAFCSSRAHARFMNRKFNELGLPSICLLGEDSTDAREVAIKRLEDENDSLRVICSVDVFGEGVDIPQVSHVLLLRPTQSFPVFLQQLGRGLRPVPGVNFRAIMVQVFSPKLVQGFSAKVVHEFSPKVVHAFSAERVH